MRSIGGVENAACFPYPLSVLIIRPTAPVLDCEAKRDGLAPSTQLGGGITGHDFPAGRTKFPVPDHREFDAMASETLANLGPDSLRGV
jgi:hypothetical protein